MLDDFGTGYSSLAHVKDFPIDVLKIDRSFVRDLESVADDEARIVEAVINMARGLRVAVVAEGVETDQHVAVLRALGCELAQGFHFARPATADQIGALLLHHGDHTLAAGGADRDQRPA